MSKPYQWVASLYFFQSLPFVVVSLISTLIFQQAGMSNAMITFTGSLLIIPWIIKPLFAPFMEQFVNKKKLTVFIQFIVALMFLIIGFSIQQHLLFTIIAFALLAMMSSIHDIISDGLYILNLNELSQKRFVALRTLFYQLGRLLLKGVLLTLAGHFAHRFGLNIWQTFFFLLCLVCLLTSVFNHFKIPSNIEKAPQDNKDHLSVFKLFFFEPTLLTALAFIFFFNISDAQLQRMLPLYLVDAAGAHLSIQETGKAYGMFGGISLMSGVFLSSLIIRRWSLSSVLITVTLFMVLGPLSLLLSAGNFQTGLYLSIVLTQLLSGLANGVFMVYMLTIANKTAYPMSAYTLCTSVMAMSILIFGSISGVVEQYLGYFNFFIYVICLNIILILITMARMKKNA